MTAWKVERSNMSMALMHGAARLDETPAPARAPLPFHYDCGNGHKSQIGGSMVMQTTDEIRSLMTEHDLRSVEQDPERTLMLVRHMVGTPLSLVVLRTVEEDYALSLRTSYPVHLAEIDQVIADIAVLTATMGDFEESTLKAVEAAMEMEQRVASLFETLEAIHCA